MTNTAERSRHHPRCAALMFSWVMLTACMPLGDVGRQSPAEVVAEGCRTEDRFGVQGSFANDAPGDPTPEAALMNWMENFIPALTDARLEVQDRGDAARATFFSASGEPIGEASVVRTESGGWVPTAFSGCGALSPGEPRERNP